MVIIVLVGQYCVRSEDDGPGSVMTITGTSSTNIVGTPIRIMGAVVTLHQRKLQASSILETGSIVIASDGSIAASSLTRS
jgi:hypothetical protein